MKDKNGATTAFTFVNDTTMLGVIGSKGNKDGVKEAAKGASTLKIVATFVDMYSKINTQDSLWMLINGNSPALAKAGAHGRQAEGGVRLAQPHRRPHGRLPRSHGDAG